MLRLMLLISHDQRQKRHGLARSRRHLQDTVTPDIEGLLEITHVGILFGIDARIREKNRKITVANRVVRTDIFLHREWRVKNGPTYSIKNFMMQIELEAQAGSVDGEENLMKPLWS